MFEFIQLYGILALTYLFIQLSLSHTDYIYNQFKRRKPIYPPVAIVIPSYNEEPKNVISCVNSYLNQNYKNLKIYFIDDGSKDKRAVREVKKLKNRNLIVIDNKEEYDRL